MWQDYFFFLIICVQSNKYTHSGYTMNRHQPENVCSIMSDKKFFYSLFIFFALLAAAGSRSDEENQALLDEKVTKLTELSNKESVIHLTGDKFKEYVRRSPRNYSIILMLTALAPHRHCAVCMMAHEEYQILASSWRYSPEYSNELFITMVDFDKTPDVFHEMKVNSVPAFFHFPAKGNRKKGDTMEVRGTFTAETMAAWIYRRTEILIKVYRPINFIYWGTVLTVLAVAGALLIYLRSKLRLIFGHTCAILILTVIFAMISGYMWNTIRNPPKMLKHPQTGEVIYIHPNRGSQLIMETYVIMLLYGSIVVGFILMNEIESLKKRWSKSLLALAGLACLVGFFFTLLQVFKMKSPYYPYGFFDLVNDYIWKL